jgi:arabinoxylan arabinofuranohydrolase
MITFLKYNFIKVNRRKDSKICPYFDCRGVKKITIKARGGLGGSFEIMTEWNGTPICTIKTVTTNEWKEYSSDISIPDGVHALYFRFVGRTQASLASFALE